jgi:hypothetical protein
VVVVGVVLVFVVVVVVVVVLVVLHYALCQTLTYCTCMSGSAEAAL